MSVIEQNYRIQGFDILLNKDCIPSKYYPLILYKGILLDKLNEKGCRTKHECAKLLDDELLQMGFPNASTVVLFRRFLTLYDITTEKL